jgi:hypothetical protein
MDNTSRYCDECSKETDDILPSTWCERCEAHFCGLHIEGLNVIMNYVMLLWKTKEAAYVTLKKFRKRNFLLLQNQDRCESFKYWHKRRD